MFFSPAMKGEKRTSKMQIFKFWEDESIFLYQFEKNVNYIANN